MAGKPVVRKQGEGDAIWMLDSLYEVKASTEETNGTMTIMEMTLPPGMGPPPHIHKAAEAVYVLDGTLRYHIDGDVFEGGPGTFFHVPEGVTENFESPAGDKPTRVLVIYAPGGMDKFFAEAGEPAKTHQLPAPSGEPPDVERLGAIAARHGLTLLPPG